MINKELQEYIKEWISKQQGRKYPCSNQIVINSICLRDPSRVEVFEQIYPHFICYRRNKIEGNRYINSRTEELWRVLFCRESIRGYRHYKVIIDSTIDEDVLGTLLLPCMTDYCCSVDFF